MKGNDSSIDEEKSNCNESIILPTFSIASTARNRKRKIKFNKKNDKDELEELSYYKLNNNNILENINEPISQEMRPEMDTINKLINFYKDKENDFSFKEEPKEAKKKLKFGRKRKNSSEIGKHNKYSGDNLIRKCKGVLLHCLYVLINKIIADNYKNEAGYNQKLKKLLKINQKQIINSDVQFNKEFINTKLKDIFSDKVTMRCSRYNLEHNKNLIKSLLTERNLEKRNLFEKIFNLTFLDCLKHFRGTTNIKELKDLTKYDEICRNFEEDEDYLYSFKFYIENYEKIINNKKSRIKKGEKKVK